MTRVVDRVLHRVKHLDSRHVTPKLLTHFVAFTAVVALTAYVALFVGGRFNGVPIHSDGYSYYVYLPSWLLNSDPTLERVAQDCCGGQYPEFTGIRRWPTTNRWVNPHPIGVAILMMPFFAIAHLLTWWSNLPPDGFSLYYQHGAGLAGLGAFVAGLAILRRLLSRHFSDVVTLATLTTIVFGTNLFHYGVYDGTFSHAFSFFLIAALLDLTDRWFGDAPPPAAPAYLGVVSALIFLTRHPNVVFLSIVALWSPRECWRRRHGLLAAAAVAALCITPQLVIYKRSTGHWFVSAYEQVGQFNFAAPHLRDVLFGVHKGLFFWSPVLLFAVAGFFVDHRWTARLRAAGALIFAIEVYLIASWSSWQFGASFGHRGFTDGFALAAVFLAAFFEWTAARRPRLANAIGVVVAVFVLLSTLQMLQYWIGVLPKANTTWDEYRAVFLKFR